MISTRATIEVLRYTFFWRKWLLTDGAYNLNPKSWKNTCGSFFSCDSRWIPRSWHLSIRYQQFRLPPDKLLPHGGGLKLPKLRKTLQKKVVLLYLQHAWATTIITIVIIIVILIVIIAILIMVIAPSHLTVADTRFGRWTKKASDPGWAPPV